MIADFITRTRTHSVATIIGTQLTVKSCPFRFLRYSIE